MTVSVLKTKLRIPAIRPDLVARAHLVERLDVGLLGEDGGFARKLTLVSAPAGSGKTTLLSEWVAQRPDPAAWLSLDEHDNDPARFWRYVIAAFQTIYDDLFENALRLLQAPQRPATPAVLTPLLNELDSLPGRLILVLDDYHAISEPSVHEGISFLLEHLPQTVHVAMCTRADPPLPIHRLRARGQLTELRWEDLRFTAVEAASFLSTTMGLDLVADDMETLKTRTEGWIVGLQLAALSLQGRSDVRGFLEAFSGGHHYVLEYLTEEVVRRQPEPIQRFLIETSILDHLCGPLCNALTDKNDGEAVLFHLHRRNMFILPLDDEHRWYRYHHLFADLLRNLARQTLTQEHIRELHLRASEWYDGNGLIPEATAHALTGADYEKASELIERAAWELLARGEVITLLRWLNALPDRVIRRRSQLAVVQAWALALTGQWDQADARLSTIAVTNVPGEVASVRGYLAYHRGQTVQADEFCREALRVLPEEQWLPRGFAAVVSALVPLRMGDPVAASQAATEALELGRTVGQSGLTMITQVVLGEAQEMQGLLGPAIETCRKALQLAGERSSAAWPFAGMAYVGLAGPLYERNHLAEALHCVTQGIELSKQARSIDTLPDGYVNLALLRLALQDFDGALKALQEVGSVAQGTGYRHWTSIAFAIRSRCFLERGDMATASRCAKKSRSMARDEASVEHEVGEIAVARVLIARARSQEATRSNEVGQALRSLTELMQTAETEGRMGSMIKILVLQALAYQAQGDVDRAMSTLGRALSLAEPEGYVRSFVDEGASIATLLHEAVARGIAPDYATRLLNALEVEAGEPASAPSRPSPSTLVEPLTDREVEVLLLLGEGYSNRQIAEELFVSLNTVKKHTSNIYGKMGVRSRTQAVVRAQELGLL